MKRKTSKIYLKIGILLFGFSLIFFNCTKEKELFGEPHAFGLFDITHQKVRIIKKQNISKSIFDFIDDRTSGTRQVILSKRTEGYVFGGGNLRTNVFGTIDDSKSVVVTFDTQTRYTFLVKPSEPNPDEVINLVIVDDGIQSAEYFIKYEFDRNNQIESAFGTIDMTTFSGTISFYNGEGVLIGDYSMNQGRTSNSTGTGISCDPNNDDPSDDPNTDDNDDNGGPGNGGCTVNCGDDDGSGDTQEPGDDSGDVTTGGGGEFCSVEIKYYRCKCGGDANGHPPSGEACCEGSPMTVTITCNDYAGRTNSSSQSNLEAFSCDSPIGAIIEKDDCEKVNEQIAKPDFKDKIQDLENKLNLPNETGYVEDNVGNYTEMESASDDGSELKFPISNTIKGFMHNHSGPVIDIDPVTGEENKYWPDNIFSPSDLTYFMDFIKNNDGTYFETPELYSTLVTFEGNYMLKFSGNVANLPETPDPKSKGMRNLYNLFIKGRANQAFGFLKMLQTYNIQDMVIYEFNSLGVIWIHYIDDEGNYKKVECN